jgi:hypothetical protein
MNKLLNTDEVFIGKEGVSSRGFLSSLLQSDDREDILVFIPYNETEYADISKAIYRMTCIELIKDFTQDYVKKRFRIVAEKKVVGGYYLGLKRFLLRYYTEDRAGMELEKAKSIELKVTTDAISEEIYRCLAYLTEFIYDKVSEKRKRAIDDMRNFCLEGTNSKATWIENNENMKDYIFYYFNSKYAKSDYIADNGEPYSLVEDSDGGKASSKKLLFKYLRVIDDEIVGVGTPLDNVKHLYGAVRLISRSLTDSNPALYLLEVFCLAYMDTKNNKNLRDQLVLRYSEGMTEFSTRFEKQENFWILFEKFNNVLKRYLKSHELEILKEETTMLIHAGNFHSIKNLYLENYE